MNLTERTPISGLDWSFRSYLDKRLAENSRHITGNDVPDYAYGMDYELRRKLDAVPGLHSLATKIYVTEASNALQEINRNAMAVTPNQFPDVYDIACDCARRLGMAMPNVYIVNCPNINASTVCTDDVQPIIQVYSGLYERFTREELKAVIGHECGHVQNNHMIYMNLVTLLANIGLSGLSLRFPDLTGLVSKGAAAALYAWSRAAEVTSDRAGMICADNIEDSYKVMAKLMYGATFKEQEVDYQSLKEQLDIQMDSLARFGEYEDEHPSGVRRIMAEREFSECSVFYSWRPDLKRPDTVMRSKDECDERCKAYISLASRKGAR